MALRKHRILVFLWHFYIYHQKLSREHWNTDGALVGLLLCRLRWVTRCLLVTAVRPNPPSGPESPCSVKGLSSRIFMGKKHHVKHCRMSGNFKFFIQKKMFA